MARKVKDRVEILEEKISKLEKLIKDKNNQIRQFKKEIKQLKEKSSETDSWLIDVTNGVPLSEILSQINGDGKLKIELDKCPICKHDNINKLIFSKFHIIDCSNCGYRNKVNEEEKI